MTKEDPSGKFKALEDAKKRVEVGGTYYHFKNPSDYYTVVDVGIIEETEEVCVMYEAQYDELKGIRWVRTLENFLEEVERDGKKYQRFTKVE